MGTIKLSTLIGQPQSAIINAINESVISPWHDVADGEYTTSTKQAVTAGTEYAFEADGVPRNVTNFPDHITEMWDAVNSKALFSEFEDTPLITARLQMNFIPGTSAEGYMEFKAYINEPDPVLIQTIRVPYKATDSRLEALFSFYAGDAAGYDLKNKGIRFRYTPKTNGSVYDRGILIFKT